MNALSTFTFNAIADIRVVTLNGDLWFVAKDVLRVLGMDANQSFNYLRHLDEADKRIVNPSNTPGIAPLWRGGAKRLSVVSEAGLYRFILRSDKPQAKPFQNWVARVVLPAIRKDGGYILAIATPAVIIIIINPSQSKGSAMA